LLVLLSLVMEATQSRQTDAVQELAPAFSLSQMNVFFRW